MIVDLEVIFARSIVGIPMEHFSQPSPYAQFVRRLNHSLLAIIAGCLGAMAVFAESGWAQDSCRPWPYQSSGSAVDPNQVFANRLDTMPLPSSTGTKPICSPYFDYRDNLPPSSQIGNFRSPALQDPGAINSPRASLSPNTGNPLGLERFDSPYYSGRYGSVQPNPIDDGSRFPTPFAGSRYGVMPQSDPAGNGAAIGGGPGGYLSPHQVSEATLDPNVSGGRGDCLLYMPFASMGYYGGTTPNSGVSDLFVPLMQSHTELLYADFRGLFNSQSAYQGSFGAGLRTLVFDSVILGGYGFYDYFGSQQHHVFQQASAGVELMTWFWEARSNGYFPTSQGSASPTGGTGTAFLQNGLIFLNGAQQTALTGFDGEIGMLLAADPTARRELRAFVGGYNFNGHNGGQNIPGVYERLEARLYDLDFLGHGSRLELGVISSYDDVNKFQVTGLLNLRISFGSTNCPGGMSLIERRMMDRVVRSQTVITSDQSATEQANVTINGHSYNSVALINGTTPNPQAVINSTPANSLIVVQGGSGTLTVPNGLTLNPGQALVGSGTQLNVTGESSGHFAAFTLPGSTPSIDRPNANGAVIEMSTNTSVIGVDLVGGMPAILGQNANNLFISNVNSSQCMCDGMQFLNVNGLTINNVTITTSDNRGLLFQNVQNANISNVTIANTSGNAVFFDGGSNIQISDLKIDATVAANDAVKLLNITNGTFTNWQINNTTNNQNALNVDTSSGLTFSQISFTNITGDGVALINSSMFSLSNSVFTNVHNDIGFVGTLSQISGTGNVSAGETTLFTGTTSGGGGIQFTTPNGTAQ